ncbi:hypothetical protein MASR1M107_07430 [Ignavibacteriales bacterium]
MSYKLRIDLLYIYKDKDKYLLRLGDFTDNGCRQVDDVSTDQRLGYTKAKS